MFVFVIALIASLVIPLAPGVPFPDPPFDPGDVVLPSHPTQGDGFRPFCAAGHCWPANDSMPPTLALA